MFWLLVFYHSSRNGKKKKKGGGFAAVKNLTVFLGGAWKASGLRTRSC